MAKKAKSRVSASQSTEPIKSGAALDSLTVEWWPIDRPRPYEKNARKLSPRAIDVLATSLKEYGWQQPIVVDLQDVIVVGHTRLMAAKKLGMEQVPVHVAANLTPAQAKAYRLMDNRSSQETSFDFDLLSAELLDLKGLNIDLSLTGFDYGELDALLGTNGQSAGDGAGAAKARATLGERFGVPPFSVLDARQGYWQDRKRAWLALGIQSELGRGDAIPGGGGGPETESAWLRGGRSNSKISGGKPLIANGGGMNSKRRYDRANGGATAEL